MSKPGPAFLWLVRTQYKLIMLFPASWGIISAVYCQIVRWLHRSGPSVLYVSLANGHTPPAAIRLPEGQPSNVLRIVCISDTHGLEGEVRCPTGDILIHSGDFLAQWANGPADLSRFARWLAKQPHEHKLVCAGNHDRCLDPLLVGEKEAAACADALREAGAIYFDMSHPTVELCGLRFFGSSYSRMSNPHSQNAAFQDAERYRVRPTACDVLITHGPPEGIRDSGFGCPELRASVDGAHKPVLHVFGHCHQEHGVQIRGCTTFVNAALSTWGWTATKLPVVVDMPRFFGEQRRLPVHPAKGD